MKAVINSNSGFTVLELMIALTIVGILASIAVPAYSLYIARTQVTESFNLMSAIKTTVREIYLEDGSLINADNGNLSIPSVLDTSSKYLEKITVVNGLITSKMNVNTSKGISNTEIAYSPITLGRSIIWVCKGGASNPMPEKYRPKSCR